MVVQATKRRKTNSSEPDIKRYKEILDELCGADDSVFKILAARYPNELRSLEKKIRRAGTTTPAAKEEKARKYCAKILKDFKTISEAWSSFSPECFQTHLPCYDSRAAYLLLTEREAKRDAEIHDNDLGRLFALRSLAIEFADWVIQDGKGTNDDFIQTRICILPPDTEQSKQYNAKVTRLTNLLDLGVLVKKVEEEAKNPALSIFIARYLWDFKKMIGVGGITLFLSILDESPFEPVLEFAREERGTFESVQQGVTSLFERRNEVSILSFRTLAPASLTPNSALESTAAFTGKRKRSQPLARDTVFPDINSGAYLRGSAHDTSQRITEVDSPEQIGSFHDANHGHSPQSAWQLVTVSASAAPSLNIAIGTHANGPGGDNREPQVGMGCENAVTSLDNNAQNHRPVTSATGDGGHRVQYGHAHSEDTNGVPHPQTGLDTEMVTSAAWPNPEPAFSPSQMNGSPNYSNPSLELATKDGETPQNALSTSSSMCTTEEGQWTLSIFPQQTMNDSGNVECRESTPGQHKRTSAEALPRKRQMMRPFLLTPRELVAEEEQSHSFAPSTPSQSIASTPPGIQESNQINNRTFDQPSAQIQPGTQSHQEQSTGLQLGQRHPFIYQGTQHETASLHVLANAASAQQVHEHDILPSSYVDEILDAYGQGTNGFFNDTHI